MAATIPIPVRGILHAAYSLCDEDCEGGNHNPEFRICDRCGSHIHNQVFEVTTEAGEELTVGSECCKDVLGYKFGTWHERALEFAAEIHTAFMAYQVKSHYRVCLPPKFLRNRGSKCVQAAFRADDPAYLRPLCYPSWSLNASLIRAGADLGLWAMYQESRGMVEVFDLCSNIDLSRLRKEENAQ